MYMQIKITMSINTKKTYCNFGDNKNFIDEKSQKHEHFMNYPVQNQMKRLHHSPFLNPKKRKKTRSLKERTHFYFFFFFLALG